MNYICFLDLEVISSFGASCWIIYVVATLFENTFKGRIQQSMLQGKVLLAPLGIYMSRDRWVCVVLGKYPLVYLGFCSGEILQF